MKKQLKGENREEIKIVYLGKEILCSVIVFLLCDTLRYQICFFEDDVSISPWSQLALPLSMFTYLRTHYCNF